MAIQNIFVVGSGLMGSGIAQNALTCGYNVFLNDQRQETLERAQIALDNQFKHEVERGRMTEEEHKDCMSRLTLATRISDAKAADLVIEAIYENLEAKTAVFEELEKVCPAHTIFASNTSSISLTALAAVTKRPERVVGMHFFSPVPKMRLCEVIFGLLTACVIVGSFIGSVEDVDNGMKLGCNHPMGPLELADMIGLDILLNVMNVMSKEYGEKYHPSLLLRKMVTAGYLGRKSGAGFYLYENGKKLGVNPVLTRAHYLETKG